MNMKIPLIIILFQLFPLYVLANKENKERNREILLSTSKSDQISAEELHKYPEIYQFSDSVLGERSLETGLSSDSYYTRQDNRRFSMSYSLSQDYENPTKIQTFDFIYFNQFDNSYRDLWWGVQFKRTSAQYDAIAEERTGSADPNSVASLIRNQELQTFSIIGMGLGHRFKALSSAFNTHRVFEFISIFTNYIIHFDNTNQESYTGFGYTADYTINKRTSQDFFYGLKISYNWALVSRAAIEQQDLEDRSLVFGWTSFGFELGYVF